MNGKQLERVKHFKYLGLWISDDLSWSYHIEAVCSKARRMLGFIYRFFSPHCDTNTILSLYKAHVLPILDYASVVWDPHLKKDQQLLDSVQHFALKIASRSWNSSSVTLHNQYKITPLINRRHYFKLLVTLMVSCTSLVVFLFIETLLTLESLIVCNCYNHLLSVVLFIILFLSILFVCGTHFLST